MSDSFLVRVGRLWPLLLAALTLVSLVAVSIANDFTLLFPTAVLWVFYLLAQLVKRRATAFA